MAAPPVQWKSVLACSRAHLCSRGKSQAEHRSSEKPVQTAVNPAFPEAFPQGKASFSVIEFRSLSPDASVFVGRNRDCPEAANVVLSSDRIDDIQHFAAERVNR